MLLAAWVWRVCHLTEEMDDYQNVYQLMMARRSGTEAVEQRRLIATQVGRNRLQAWISDEWYNRLGGYCGGSLAGLTRTLRYGSAASPIEVQGVLFGLFIVCFGLFLSRFSYMAKAGTNFGGMIFFIQFAVLMPGQMAGEMLAMRRPRLPFEMLLPASRTQLVDALFAVSARNSFVLWFIMNAAICIVFALVTDEITIQTAAMYWVLSGASMFAAMGLSLRFSVWPSRAKRFVVLFASWIPLLIPTVAWWHARDKIGDWPFVLAAFFMVILGGALLAAARRAWQNLELA
jgi:hypothetical protein